MIDQLKDLKDTYEIVKTTIDKFKEPKEEMVKLAEFLKTLATDSSILNEKVDKDYKRYFYEDFSSGLVKRLNKEKSNDEKYLQAIVDCLRAFLQILLNHLKNETLNQGFLDAVKQIFDYDCFLHTYNFLISEEQLNEIRLAGQTWRNTLEVGQMIDAIQDEFMRAQGWSQALITQINGDILQIQFVKDSKSCDKYIERRSLQLAPFESKSKAIFEWKDTLKPGDQVDAFDKNSWNKSTILDIFENSDQFGRTIKVANIAFRIYVEKSSQNKKDDKGQYDGYSDKFDELIPLYSPKIQYYLTKSQRQNFYDDVDVDDDLDQLYPKEQGQERVYVVPRNRRCTSSIYVQLVNEFGNQGGFDLVKQRIINNNSGKEDQSLDLNVIGSLLDIASKPFILYNKDFYKEYAPEIVKLAKVAVNKAADKNLRDINKDKVEQYIRSIDNLLKRGLNKQERDKEIEILKLDISLLCLKSPQLDKRIQGIKDLNQVIRNNRTMYYKTLPTKFILEWLKENQIINVIFDVKNTHAQIVQRAAEVLKLLLQEDQLDEQLFERFWSLSRSDYKVEIYKILTDIAFNLKKEHFDHLYNQLITNTNIEKMSIDDFQFLNDLSKNSKEETFKENVNKFFWSIISKQYQDGKGSQMIVTAMNFIKTNQIKFYKKPTYNAAPMNQPQASSIINNDIIEDSLNKRPLIAPNIDESQKTNNDNQQEIEQQIIQQIINNLKSYCQQANEKVKQYPELLQEQRKKMFLINQKYSHHEEIEERLQFIKYLTSISSGFKITKEELNAIYQLLVTDSLISSDSEEFLIWCKSLCEQSSITKSILDLSQVGEFFTEKMQSKELDLKHLPTVGFEFLQHYFLSVNEKNGKIFKSVPKNAQKSKFMNNYNMNINFNGNFNSQKINNQKYKEDKQPVFKLVKLPHELEQLDIVWNIALQSENPNVIPKAINFLISVHYQLDEDLSDQKINIQDQLIEKCMEIIKTSKDEFSINRAIDILKNIIYEAEKKGTGDVQPHNAVLKGELLERIQIRNRANSKKSNIWMSIYSNTTVWELKKEIAKQLDLGPKYLKLERNNGAALNDLDHGKTLAELGLQSQECLSAYKIYIEEEVANAPLIGPDQKLTEKLKAIFNEWFDMYSNEEGSMTKETCANFIKGCTGEFPSSNDERILGLFNQYDINKDGKIERTEFLKFYENSARAKPETVRENLKSHNIRADLKKLSEIQEESSFKTEDMPRYKISENQEYFDQLIALLDRPDTVSQNAWDLIQMLATNQQLYKRVLELKNALDQQTQKINWEKFFSTESDYKLLYTLQIIEAVMEEGEGENLERINIIQDINEYQSKKSNTNAANVGETPSGNVPNAPPTNVAQPPPALVQNPPPAQNNTKTQNVQEEKVEEQKGHQPLLMKKNTSVLKDEEMSQKLKSEWTSMFLNHEGIQYIMKVFMDKDITVHKQEENKGQVQSFSQIFELKHIAFLLKLLRIFIMAAFSTNKESSVYQGANLVRKSSHIQNEDEQFNQQNDKKEQESDQEGSRFKELQILLKGPLGQQIIDQIDYKQLQQKILKTITQILSKPEMVFEDKLIIENALSLWVGCILHNKDLFNEFQQFTSPVAEISNSDQLILKGLLECPYEKIREEFKASLSTISQKIGQKNDNALKYFLNLLSSNFDKISNSNSKQYFELFCSLVDIFFERRQFNKEENQSNFFNPEVLLTQAIDKMKEYHDLVEKMNNALEGGSQNNNEVDEESQAAKNAELESVYIGLIQLVGKIIENFDISLSEKIIEEKHLIEEIFSKFLFANVLKEGQKLHEKKEIKIQPKKKRQSGTKSSVLGKKSKDACYKLINRLIQRSPLLMNNFLDKCMFPIMNAIRRPEGWNYQPQGTNVSNPMTGERHQKYVGLRNLGCICYMNAMLQQFFMIPAFRYNLLCVDDKCKEDVKEYKGKQVDDNLLHQLQKLMAHLELSERQDYNPFEFCFSFKDLDGNPTNTSEQKDAFEFLNLVFDRIETMLKGTSRKYLLQSIFGGQLCSQIVCSECGKIKNRMDDFYNLALTVKDLKSMQESLQKLLDGEVISGYNCDGCNKKVDISKRTLIAQTPNVLIINLQRLLFNFETFRIDKVNTFFEFPNQLDLRPYSFYEVMKQEDRIKTKKEGDEDEESSIRKVEEDQAEEEKKEDQNKDEKSDWPAEDDCFEYKLVGATVHSGTAQSGHYWSYINTNRGFLEPEENDPNWNKTENEPWMEYNDSRVSDFNFDKFRDECFGDQNNKSGGYDDGWSSWGSYGKSAYMLIYERKKKKPIKVVLDKAEAEEAKAKGEDIIYNEEKDEYIKHIDYREGVEDIAPNQIYKQVFEDNKKFEFDNDIYSTEFFEFLRSILQSGNNLQQQALKNEEQTQLNDKVQEKVLQLGKKSLFEILARCNYGQGVAKIVENMVEQMKTNPKLCHTFLNSCYQEDQFEQLFQVLLENPDQSSRSSIANLIKFVVSSLKKQEKDIIFETDEEVSEYKTWDGKTEQSTEQIPRALSAKFIKKCIENLNGIIAKNWSKFEHLLEIMYVFGVGCEQYDQDLTEEQKKEYERVGIEFYFKHQFVGKVCDFILGKKSPLSSPGDKRYEMGGSYAYTQPNFSAIVKLLTTMITNQEFLEKYPLNDLEKKLLLQQDFLKVMLGQSQGSKLFGQSMASVCKGNFQQSKKVAKIFLKLINSSNFDNGKNYLKALKPFLKIDDEFKTQRIEWIFGFPQIITRREYMENNRTKIGLETISRVQEDVYTYVSPIRFNQGPSEEALLAQLLKCKTRNDSFAFSCLKEMLSLIAKDDKISEFVFKIIPPSYQYSRYTDWMKNYLDGAKSELEKSAQYGYALNKLEIVKKAIIHLQVVEEKLNQIKVTEKAQFEEAKNANPKFTEDYLAYQNPDILERFPPQLVIGKIQGEKEIAVFDEDPLVRVSIYQLENEFNYSNPAYYFNLSIPHVELRTGMYQTLTYSMYKRTSYEQVKMYRQREEHSQKIQEDQGDDSKEELKEQEEEYKEPQVRNWYETRQVGPAMIRVVITNKTNDNVKFKVSLRPANPDHNNVLLPESEFCGLIFSGENKVIGYFQRINPIEDWTGVLATVQAHVKTYGQPPAATYGGNPSPNNAHRRGAASQVRINVYDQNGSLQISDNGQVSLTMPKTISCSNCSIQINASSTKCPNCGNFNESGTTDPQDDSMGGYHPGYGGDGGLYSNY